jgi:hypothetical protein
MGKSGHSRDASALLLRIRELRLVLQGRAVLDGVDLIMPGLLA